MELLRQGDVWNRTKPCVFSRKVAPGDDGGNFVCATGAAGAWFALGWRKSGPPVSALRRGDL